MKNILVILMLSLVWFGCTSDNNKNAVLEVRLTDAPGDYEAVLIDVQGVEVNASGDNSGWKSLNVSTGVYDLLKLTNGLDTLLGRVELPAGKISQIRLILGSNNTVKIAGQSMPMSTPSAQQSGLKLNVQTQLVEGVTYKFMIDFDAARSIVKTGNGGFILKPVIRTTTTAESGSIKGVVAPVAANPAIFAIMGTDTLATTYPDTTGKFILKGVGAGKYTVSFSPKTGYVPQVKTDVMVTVGSTNDLGTIMILQ